MGYLRFVIRAQARLGWLLISVPSGFGQHRGSESSAGVQTDLTHREGLHRFRGQYSAGELLPHREPHGRYPTARPWS